MGLQVGERGRHASPSDDRAVIRLVASERGVVPLLAGALVRTAEEAPAPAPDHEEGGESLPRPHDPQCAAPPSTSPSAPRRSVQYCLRRSAVGRSGSFECCTATWLFATPFPKKPISTDVRSGQVTRIDLLARAVRTSRLTSGSQRVRVRGSLNARYSRASGTAKVLLLLVSNPPSRRWPMARRPLIRSYPTVTVWLHQSGVLYFVCTYRAMRRCGHANAWTRSSACTQRSHVQPVLALSAASLIIPASLA